jgi:predicted CxxxxCH...CXXCH cytochrome family protein
MRRRMVLLMLALASACASERDRESNGDGDGDGPTLTWDEPIGALVAERCSSCHGTVSPAGAYDLTTYLGALSGGSDEVANAVAGERSSRFLTVLADAQHEAVADLAPMLTTWVVIDRLALRASRVHDPGILNPADPGFHGALLATRSFDFALCASCHGADFAGGTSAASCVGCHAEGPTTCATCHADLSTRGAHGAHLTSPALDRPTACDGCHVVPASWDAPGHLFDADGHVDPPPAEVVLGALASRDVVPPRRTAPARFDAATGTCSGVYCHGGTLGEATATRTSPSWRGGPAEAECGACHGAPPANHVSADCRGCHPDSLDASVRLTGAGHLDGHLDLGGGDGTCFACHGDASSPAPPRDLSGHDRPQALGVGAHRSHVEGTARLADPIACAECHQMPTALGSPGHVDSAAPAEVFPLGGGPLATATGAIPVWDRATATCADVYCHGGGELGADVALGLDPTPIWTAVDQGEAVCGRCHGLPPQNGTHPPATLADCTTCHPTVDAVGNILFTGAVVQTTRHIDGHVDVR